MIYLRKILHSNHCYLSHDQSFVKINWFIYHSFYWSKINKNWTKTLNGNQTNILKSWRQEEKHAFDTLSYFAICLWRAETNILVFNVYLSRGCKSPAFTPYKTFSKNKRGLKVISPIYCVRYVQLWDKCIANCL